jgi:hypothetical protein
MQSWAFATFFPFRYSLIRYFNVAIRYRYSATFQKFAIRYSLFATSFEQCNRHRWASASRKLTPTSAFRHLSFQSGTGTKNAGLNIFIPVPDCFRHR